MKWCDLFSGLDAHDQILKRAPVRDFTTIVSEPNCRIAGVVGQFETDTTIARHPGRTQEILGARGLFNESPTYRQ